MVEAAVAALEVRKTDREDNWGSSMGNLSVVPNAVRIVARTLASDDITNAGNIDRMSHVSGKTPAVGLVSGDSSTESLGVLTLHTTDVDESAVRSNRLPATAFGSVAIFDDSFMGSLAVGGNEVEGH
ncbi:hypothetical protein ACQP1G_17365 [Nocardia sp. CA-107356]|uniref:hypothetical protein n=1 Tax=Nocardia sp. CA-107356 TaxID=3239972 RepID=UPI003D93669E